MPEIALLGDQPVNVSVSFDQLTGEQTKRSVFYLTDYLELTLWELESLGIEGGPSFSLPPLYQGRTSLLGSLLGELELELTEQTQTIAPFAFNSGLAGSNTFTLTPTPTTIVYLATNDAIFSTDVNAWRTLSDHTAPSSLMDAKLVIATGDSSDQLISDLDPLMTNLPTSNALIDVDGGAITVRGLVIPEDTLFAQRVTNPGRSWNLSTIENDGSYVTAGFSPLAINSIGLQVTGQGQMRLSGPLDLNAVLLQQGEGHSIALRNTTSTVQHSIDVQQLENAGNFQFSTFSQVELNATERLDNTGSIFTVEGSQTEITTPLLANEGTIAAWHPATVLEISHPETFGQINLQSANGTGLFQTRFDASMRFTHTVLLDNAGNNPQPLRFEAIDGGSLQFDGPIRAFNSGVAELYVDETSSLVLRGVEVKRENANVSLVNKGVVDVFGPNLFYYNPAIPWGPGEEPQIIGINVENEGTIRIHPFATFGFKAEIANYTPGGATLGPGTWEVIGNVPANPYLNDGSVFALGKATLEISIARISNEDTYLGRIDFGDTNGDGINDGYSAEDYDTQLAVSEANVLLSGAALFSYFNTIRENQGTFTLRNNNHFTTAGDLLNRGEINVELNARLNVAGNFVVDEGTVVVDSSSVLDVSNTLEVIGGTVTVERGAVPLAINSPWIVREKWLGEDAMGNDIIRESRVSYGEAWFPTLGPNADVLLEGEQAVFEPLAGLNQIQGKLALTGGNELHLAQDLENHGFLELASAGKLFVEGDFLTSGMLTIGADSYLEVTGNFASEGGVVELDGVVQADSFTVDASSVLTGSGRLAGMVQNDAVVSPGNSPGVLEVFGDYNQSADGTLAIEIAGAFPGIEYDELMISDSATLDGLLDVSLSGGYFLELGQEFTVLSAGTLLDDGLVLSTAAATYFELVVNPGTNGSVVLRFLGGEFSLPGDFDFDYDVDGFDLLKWQRGETSNPLGAVEIADWQNNFGTPTSPLAQAVPEPATWVLASSLVFTLLRSQVRRYSVC